MAKDDPTACELLLSASEAGMDQLSPLSFTAEEGLSSPFQLVLDARTIDPGDPATIDASAWLRKKLAVGLARGGDPTWFHGVVVAVEHLGGDQLEHQLYRLEVAPSVALLKHTRRTRVFSDMTAIDVVKQVLDEGGVSNVETRCYGSPATVRHLTQFEESDFAFISRLLEQEGASYWFTHGETAHTLVIGDSTASHPGSGNAIHATFSFAGAKASASEGVVTNVSRRFEVVSKDVVVRDYSEGHPKQPAMAQKSVAADKAPGSVGKHNEADYHVSDKDAEVTAYASHLAESMVSRSCRLVGSSGVVAFRAGARVAVHGKDGYDEHMLLSKVSHRLADGIYGNSFSAVPVSRLPWRPLRTTPIPRIDGVIPGVITSAAGAQGAGEDGSYKVKILNGETGTERTVRMAQPYAGPAQGMHFPLPVDTEVMLAHEYGHPDRPIITGAMHNAEDASVVVDANKSQCVIRSAAGAVLVFEDKQDEEKVTLQSKTEHKLEFDDANKTVTLQSKDANKLEFNDKDEKTTLSTKGGQKLEFLDSGGGEKLTLYASKDHALTVDGESTTKVTGKTTIDCQDEIEITATNKITLKVAGHSIVISSKGIEISSTGDITLDAKGKAAISAVAGAELSAKADTAISGLNVKVEGQVGATVKGNATAEISSSGVTTVKGTMVMIN